GEEYESVTRAHGAPKIARSIYNTIMIPRKVAIHPSATTKQKTKKQRGGFAFFGRLSAKVTGWSEQLTPIPTLTIPLKGRGSDVVGWRC
ncbi:MAG: hypothetical protein WCE88_08995, partial [Burkholderiales bacterium]